MGQNSHAPGSSRRLASVAFHGVTCACISDPCVCTQGLTLRASDLSILRNRIFGGRAFFGCQSNVSCVPGCMGKKEGVLFSGCHSAGNPSITSRHLDFCGTSRAKLIGHWHRWSRDSLDAFAKLTQIAVIDRIPSDIRMTFPWHA